MTNTSRPRELTLRTYQVGFGDCFLLTFHYPPEEGGDRHVLIDFGSTEAPDGVSRGDMLLKVAEDIRDRCKGKLHAVVATHRHADHINGFATKRNRKGSGDIIYACAPNLVVQPWTEDPDAPNNPLTVSKSPDDGKAFFQSRFAMHEISDTALKAARRLETSPGCSKAVLDQLHLLSLNNQGEKDPANKSAIDNLTAMGKRQGARAVYVSYGKESGLEALLPGVKVHVLGPPTLDQSREILKERHSAPDEFWQLYLGGNSGSWRRLADALRPAVEGGGEPLFPDSPASLASKLAPPHTRWFIRHMNAVRSEQLLELVRVLDGVLNNTSVILLFEIGKEKLLFPGDAQLENWSYALKNANAQERERIEALLRGTTVYKVGHHGSRNATPKSLWKLIDAQGLRSVVSTKAGKHGKVDRKTEVPRETLLTELRKHAFFSTQELEWGDDPKDPPSRAFKFKLDEG
jgi:hypothetical protein